MASHKRTNKQTNKKKNAERKMRTEKWYQSQREREFDGGEWAKMNERIVISKKMSFIFGFHDARHTQAHTHIQDEAK